jgi:hypothetical protein
MLLTTGNKTSYGVFNKCTELVFKYAVAIVFDLVQLV